MPFALIIWTPYHRLNKKETLGPSMTENPVLDGSQGSRVNTGENPRLDSEEIDNNHNHWYQSINWRRMHSSLDIVGIILLIAIFAFLLVPLVADGGAAEGFNKRWLISLLIIGVIVLIPSWIRWEWRQGEDALVPLDVGYP